MAFERKPQEEDQALSTYFTPGLQQVALDFLDGDIDVKSILQPHPKRGLKLFNEQHDVIALLAKRFQSDKDKQNDLRSLVIKYPYLLADNQALANELFPGIQTIIPPSLADYYVLWGDEPSELKALIEKNPHLLYEVTEARDLSGRRVQGTIYQKALGAGDFEMAEMIKSFLTPEEEDKQYRAQFPEGWEKDTEKKLAEMMKALNEVCHVVKDAKSTTRDELNIECKPTIDNFKKYLQSENETVKNTGYYFDFQFLAKASEHLYQNIKGMGEECSPKLKELFLCQSLLGSIQLRVSARDMHESLRGMFLFNENKPAPRILKMKDGTTVFFRSSDGRLIGDNFLISLGGGHAQAGVLLPDLYKTYAEKKQKRHEVYAANRQSEKVNATNFKRG